MEKKIKIVVCDDHEVVRKGIIKLADDCPDLEVVGEASNGKNAIKKVTDLKPDVVLLDIALPDLNGLLALPLIKEAHPDCQVVIFSMHDKEAYVFEALKFGAIGYLLKIATNKEIYTAIKKASQGKYHLSPEINANIIKKYLSGDEAKLKEETKYDLLTEREQQVFRLIVQGHSSKDIAKVLYISPRTVEKHKANFMKKIDIFDTVSLIRFAMKIGIIDPEIW